MRLVHNQLTVKDNAPSQCEKAHLNTNELEDRDVSNGRGRLLGRGRGILGLNIDIQRSIINGLGLGIFVFGVYLLFVSFGVVSFSPRFSFIPHENKQILLLSILLITAGAAINERIRNIFQE